MKRKKDIVLEFPPPGNRKDLLDEPLWKTLPPRAVKDPVDKLSPEAMLRSIEINLEAVQSSTTQLDAEIKKLPGSLREIKQALSTVRFAVKTLETVLNRRKK